MDEKFSRKNFEKAGINGIQDMLFELKQAIDEDMMYPSDYDRIIDELNTLGHNLRRLHGPMTDYKISYPLFGTDYEDQNPDGLEIQFGLDREKVKEVNWIVGNAQSCEKTAISNESRIIDTKLSRKNFEQAGLDGLKVLLPELGKAIEKEIEVVSNLDLSFSEKGQKFFKKCEEIRNQLTETGHKLYQLDFPDYKDIYEHNMDVWASDYSDCNPNGLCIEFRPLKTLVIWVIGKNRPDMQAQSPSSD